MRVHAIRPGLAGAGVVLAGTMLGVLVAAAPASAHVTVSSADATKGGEAQITFRVPNEKDTASTTKVEVDFPDDAPIASVAIKPVPGWTAQTETRKLDKPVTDDDGAQITEVVSKITWTAGAGAAIGAGQFQEFVVSAGPLPEVDSLVFKALQTYSDGDVVRWIDVPSAGVSADQLEHPAPTLTLTSESASGTAGGSSGDGAALGFGIAGTVLGLAGLAVALYPHRRAFMRGRS
jgi:uncharacterized protein YcnI